MVIDPTPRRARRFLPVLFIVHGIVTAAAAAVLVVSPATIPATVGIRMEGNEFLLSYFLAAAEVAIALLSVGATRLTDTAALKLIVGVFIVFHLSTAALEVLYLVLTGFDAALVANVAIRVVVAALFAVAARRLRLDVPPGGTG